MSENYIEVFHEYEDKDFDTCRDTWWAVRPTPYKWRNSEGEMVDVMAEPWKIQGDIYVWDKQDIAGIRKLLDKLDEVL